MPSFTERLARGASRRPVMTIAAWLLALATAIATIVILLPTALASEFGLTNNPESDQAAALIEERIPPEDETDEIVIVRSETLDADDPAFREAAQELTDRIRQVEGVERVGSVEGAPVSADGDAILLPVELAGDEEDAEVYTETLVPTVTEFDGNGQVRAFITGEPSSSVDLQALSQHDLKTGELYFGGPAALVILLLVFGALVAATLPLILAMASIVIALGIVAIVGQVFEISLFVVNMITAMGLALGIDYSLFVLSRFREERAHGADKHEAIATAGATASRAVFFSGFTFVVALLGMLLVPVSVLASLAAGAIIVGAVAVVAALTLLPAVLALLGDRVNKGSLPVVGRSTERAGAEGRFWSWAARAVMRRAVVSLVVVVALLVALATPVLDLEMGSTGISLYPDRYPSKQGFTVLSEEFPTTTTFPIEVVVDGDVGSSDVTAAIDRFRSEVAGKAPFGEPDVRVEEDENIALVTVPIAGDPDASEATAAVERLRAETIPRAFEGTNARVLVGGDSAANYDYLEATRTWLPRTFVIILGLSLILLAVAFRSIVIPIKAILLNLLSVGAAYGVLVLVFQKGVGADFLGLTQVDSIEAWVPLFLFSVLFGLSMDYHVFLLSRIRERYVATGDNTEAVTYGVGSTARLITGAALIIIAVFTGFAIGDLVMFQQMGVGVAVALFLDATIIRSVLLPASMKLLGNANWYLPSWLRWLPDVAVEGKPPADARPHAGS